LSAVLVVLHSSSFGQYFPNVKYGSGLQNPLGAHASGSFFSTDPKRDIGDTYSGSLELQAPLKHGVMQPLLSRSMAIASQ
jgi:hypothetical protein